MIHPFLKLTLVCALIALAPQGAVAQTASAATPPVVVELFTSKFCPNCPPTEKRMAKEVAATPELLLLQQHVDYWDKGPRKDPFGLEEATQRQYDYSNTLGRRAGEVFTPMPILNGRVVAKPPIWMGWESTVETAKDTPPVLLTPALQKDGSLTVLVGEGERMEAWLFGVEPMESPNALRVRAIAPMTLEDGRARLSAALLPKTPEFVVLVQKRGAGPVIGVGRLKAQ